MIAHFGPFEVLSVPSRVLSFFSFEEQRRQLRKCYFEKKGLLGSHSMSA